MKCKEVKKLLNYQMDMLKSIKSYDLLEKHLQECSSCRMEKEKLLKYKEILRDNFHNIDIPELSASFDAKFHSRLAGESRESIFAVIKQKLAAILDMPFERRLIPALSAVALLSFVIVKVYFYPFHANTNSQANIRSNGAILIEFAVLQNKKAEQKKLIEAQTKQLLKNIL